MRIGDIEIDLITDGYFGLDGGAMFGIVPRALWEKTQEVDDRNRIRLGLRTLLLRGRGKVLLVDTGMGDKWTEKDRKIYAIDRSAGGLAAGLAALGIRPEDVTDVLLTHLHFDHAGGGTRRDAGGRLVPSFPNATYHVQKLNWDWAQNPTPKDRGSFLPDDYVPLQEAGVLRLHDGAIEIAPGIETLVVNGHTPGMQLPRIRTDAGDHLYVADLVPTAAHLRIPWVMGFDLFPLTTIQEKQEILGRAADEGVTLVFEHDAKTGTSRIRRDGEHFALEK